MLFLKLIYLFFSRISAGKLDKTYSLKIGNFAVWLPALKRNTTFGDYLCSYAHLLSKVFNIWVEILLKILQSILPPKYKKISWLVNICINISNTFCTDNSTKIVDATFSIINIYIQWLVFQPLLVNVVTTPLIGKKGILQHIDYIKSIILIQISISLYYSRCFTSNC